MHGTYRAMGSTPKQPSPERNQTDESLRAEREWADRVVTQKLAAIEETADAVIERARARADEVLATSRAKADRDSQYPETPHVPELLLRERVLEDQAVQ